MLELPSMYWMILIGVFTSFICFVLYQLAMLLRESAKAVEDSRKVIQDAQGAIQTANEVILEFKEIIDTEKGVLNEINSALLVPIHKVGSVFRVISSFIQGIGMGKSK